VRGNLIPKPEIKKKEKAQKEKGKEEEEGDMIDVPNKLLKQAIEDAKEFFYNEPDAENIYVGLGELSELKIVGGKKTKKSRDFLESF
jgi:hypothetical protein